MILVSCRRGFDSNEFFGDLAAREYPQLPSIDLHQDLPLADVVARAANKRVLVLVHGFHNPIADVASAYAELETALTARGMLGTAPWAYDVVIGFLWPGFATDIGFFPAIPSANKSGERLEQLLALLNTTARAVDIQTHSLGARVGLQALAFPLEAVCRHLILTAPAVDDEVVEPGQEFNASLKACARCWIYWSVNDPVLKTAYRLAEWDCALGWHGTQHPPIVAATCPGVYTVDCSDVVNSHGGYREAPAVYDHWARVLAESDLARVDKLQGIA